MRLTVRLRLTLLYGAMFIGAGAVLLAINYELARRNLPEAVTIISGQSVSGEIGIPPGLPASPVPADGAIGSAIISDGSIDIASQIPGELVAVLDDAQRFRDNTLDQLLIQSVLALALTAAGSIALGWFIAGRVLRPVHSITAAARDLSEQHLGERLNLEGPNDELKELADTFDDMLGRLATAFDQQRRFAANASHELRTPLAIIRTVLETSEDETTHDTAERLLPVVERAEHAIEALLVLARSTPVLATNDPVDLAHPVELALA